MNTAYEKLLEHFEERELRYAAQEDRQSVTADFRGEVGTFRVVARVDDADGLFQVFAYLPVRTPVGARPAIAEAIVRANFGLKVGKFELDMEDGEVLFQAAQVFLADGSGDGLSGDVIGRLIATSLAMLDRYAPAFLSVIYGNEPPRDAIRRIEADISLE